MRKALIAAIVATALFAVGAFAASFAVEAEDVASGADDVTECASKVDVDFDTVYDGTSDWNVASAVVTFYTDAATPTTTSGCDGYGLTLMLELEDSEGGTSEESGEVVVDGTSETVQLDNPVKASEIIGAAVLVDGKALNVETPGGGDGDVGITAP